MGSTSTLELGAPGEDPFTRGIYPRMYRDRLWTMRQYAGFGSAEETNERFRYLLAAGQTGLSVAFDLPTQMGYDSDHPKAAAEVGRVGVAIDSLADMELLFDRIPLSEVSTSMTINATAVDPAAPVRAGGREAGRRAGSRSPERRRTTSSRSTQLAGPTSIRRSPRCGSSPTSSPTAATELPRWNTISISGYHMREAGCTAVQEVAFTLADGDRLRAGRGRRRSRRRRLRSAPFVLLRLPHELLRGGCEVPGRPAVVGARS